MLRSKITIGAAQEAYDIHISTDQGVFPDLTRCLWLFIVVISENIPSLSNISISLSSLSLDPYTKLRKENYLMSISQKFIGRTANRKLLV